MPVLVVHVVTIHFRPPPSCKAKTKKCDSIIVACPGQNPVVPFGNDSIPISVEHVDLYPARDCDFFGERKGWIIADIDIVAVAVEAQAPAAIRVVHPGRIADESAVVAAGGIVGVTV